MSEASKKSEPKSSKDTPEPISSLGSVDGNSHCEPPDGRKTAKSGPGVVPASHSPRREKGKALKTKGTSGPISFGSSPSAVLQQSLENRLRARLDANGSLEYDLTWKHWDTESDAPICALRASARRTSVSVFIGWPTATGTDGERRGNVDPKCPNQTLNHASQKAAFSIEGWPKTPQASDGEGGIMQIRPGTTGKYKLRDFAQLAGYPTATACNRERDEETMKKCAAFRKRNANQDTVPLYLGEVCQFAGWAAPTATKTTQSGPLKNKDGNPWDGTSKPYQNGNPVTTALGDQVKMAGWTTTTTRDSKWEGKDGPNRTGGPSLPAMALGVILELFLVPTGRRVVLAPEFSLWLMGFPPSWQECAPNCVDWLEAQARLELKYSKEAGTL